MTPQVAERYEEEHFHLLYIHPRYKGQAEQQRLQEAAFSMQPDLGQVYVKRLLDFQHVPQGLSSTPEFQKTVLHQTPNSGFLDLRCCGWRKISA